MIFFKNLNPKRCKGTKIGSVVLILGLFSGSASAQVGPLKIFSYIGTDYAQVSIDPRASQSLDNAGFRLRLGIQLHRYLDLELVLGGSEETSNSVFDHYNANYAGVFIKGYAPLTKNWMAYTLLGGTQVRLEQRIDDTTLSDEELGFSYGVGIERWFFYNINGSLDYTVYLSDDGLGDVSAVTLGLKWHI